MGYFRLFRRFKIAPGVTINLSKSGLSTSLGPKGAKVTIGRRGVRKTVGIPGTGVSYTSTTRASSGPPTLAAPVAQAPAGRASGGPNRGWLGIGLAVVVFAAHAARPSCDRASTAPPLNGLLPTPVTPGDRLARRRNVRQIEHVFWCPTGFERADAMKYPDTHRAN